MTECDICMTFSYGLIKCKCCNFWNCVSCLTKTSCITGTGRCKHINCKKRMTGGSKLRNVCLDESISIHQKCPQCGQSNVFDLQLIKSQILDELDIVGSVNFISSCSCFSIACVVVKNLDTNVDYLEFLSYCV